MNFDEVIANNWVKLKHDVEKVFRYIPTNNVDTFYRVFFAKKKDYNYNHQNTAAVFHDHVWHGFEKIPLVIKEINRKEMRIIATGNWVEIDENLNITKEADAAAVSGNAVTNLQAAYSSEEMRRISQKFTDAKWTDNPLGWDDPLDPDWWIDPYAPNGGGYVPPPYEPAVKRYIQVRFSPLGGKEDEDFLNNAYSYDVKENNVTFYAQYDTHGYSNLYPVGDKTDFNYINDVLFGNVVMTAESSLQKFYNRVFGKENNGYAYYEDVKDIVRRLMSLSDVNKKYGGSSEINWKDVDKQISLAMKNAFYHRRYQDEVDYWNHLFDWQGDHVFSQFINDEFYEFWIPYEDCIFDETNTNQPPSEEEEEEEEEYPNGNGQGGNQNGSGENEVLKAYKSMLWVGGALGLLGILSMFFRKK
ncbi:MAG: hypothetical protein LBC68_13650 [Prevotellaceae bacterium]|jgi:hypothetical protein|nr:hypothetical protein [Prevotellaceae bacterium]